MKNQRTGNTEEHQMLEDREEHIQHEEPEIRNIDKHRVIEDRAECMEHEEIENIKLCPAESDVTT